MSGRFRQGGACRSKMTRILLDETIARAVADAAGEAGQPASGVFTYVANAIRARGREVPYSVIAAADLGRGALGDVHVIAGSAMPPASADAHDSIWLTEWAWRDLGVQVGEPLDVEYFHWEESAGLVTRTARFSLAGVVSIGGDVNATLAPEVPGITEARNLRDWDPPFPMDLRRIRPQDEVYWEQHRGTPKAFVTLASGQALWRSRFGQLTAVRTALPDAALASTLASRIDPESAGFTIAALRRNGLDASRGSVDLGEYFLYFSAFLIAAAVLLSASFFRLGVEQRVREVGTLRAVGFSAGTLRRIFLGEGVVLLLVGSLLGAAGALAYGGALIAGLRTWWIGAIGTERVHLHVSWTALGAGVGAGVAASLGAIVWTLRGLARSSPRALLAGVLESRAARASRARVLAIVPPAALAAAGLDRGRLLCPPDSKRRGFLRGGHAAALVEPEPGCVRASAAPSAPDCRSRLARARPPRLSRGRSPAGAQPAPGRAHCLGHVHHCLRRRVPEGLTRRSSGSAIGHRRLRAGCAVGAARALRSRHGCRARSARVRRRGGAHVRRRRVRVVSRTPRRRCELPEPVCAARAGDPRSAAGVPRRKPFLVRRIAGCDSRRASKPVAAARQGTRRRHHSGHRRRNHRRVQPEPVRGRGDHHTQRLRCAGAPAGGRDSQGQHPAGAVDRFRGELPAPVSVARGLPVLPRGRPGGRCAVGHRPAG